MLILTNDGGVHYEQIRKIEEAHDGYMLITDKGDELYLSEEKYFELVEILVKSGLAVDLTETEEVK